MGVPLSIANGIGLPVRQDLEGNDISIRANPSGTHVVAHVVGYWQFLTQVGGSGSGIDADLLDGLDSTAFAASDHSHPSSGVTAVTAGAGLTGGGTSGSVTLNVATSRAAARPRRSRAATTTTSRRRGAGQLRPFGFQGRQLRQRRLQRRRLGTE